jgi:hypothetical protein
MTSQKLLQISLLAGTAYFLCMSAAHFVGFKVPILFVYYDVPSNHYQDMIISFCAFTYATLFFAASRQISVVPAVLVAMAGTVLGLSAVNLSADIGRLIGDASRMAYWLQTGMIAGLLAWLGALYAMARKTA